MGWVINSTPLPLLHGERHDTHYTGGWVGPRAGLDGHGKSRIKAYVQLFFFKWQSYLHERFESRNVDNVI